MDKIVQAFDHVTGQVYKDEQGQLKVQVVADWPISGGLKRGKEYKSFFEWAKNLNNYHPHIKDVSFQQLCLIRYQTKLYDERVNSFSIFSEEEQDFLQCYHKLRQWPEFCKPKELFSVMEDSQIQGVAEKILQNFEIESDTVRCKDAIELQILISYVKCLLQLFPQIKEFRNIVYQCETRSCIEQINQSPLDFNPDALSIREFLEEKQQQILQLQMVDGDEWTGLIKVYQVLQKTNFLMEGQYTVVKLECLLTLNMLMDFRTFMLSIKAPYIILMACEANQLLKAETTDMIKLFFETMKRNPFIKIIFTIRSEDRATPSLQNVSRDKFGNALVTKVEQSNWCDLTSSSQKKLLEKSVKFQDANISLKEIMSAEFAVPNFLPFGALVEEKELKIADQVPNSNGYDERYYIGRTLRHQKAIKREIFSDKDVKEKHVFLASTEQEFEQLCQMNPNSSVHWLDIDKSGKLLWRQSQGT
jgi:3-dehydroquinate dehydratase